MKKSGTAAQMVSLNNRNLSVNATAVKGSTRARAEAAKTLTTRLRQTILAMGNAANHAENRVSIIYVEPRLQYLMEPMLASLRDHCLTKLAIQES